MDDQKGTLIVLGTTHMITRTSTRNIVLILFFFFFTIVILTLLLVIIMTITKLLVRL